jgi:hypothetical protein
MDRFFIRNCMGDIVGNPKGYRTMRGAMVQHDSKKSKVHQKIWADYQARVAWYEASCMPMPLRSRKISSVGRQSV